MRTQTDHIETLTSAPKVYLGQKADQPMEVEGVRLHKGSPLLKLQGVNNMDEALSLKGVEICLPGEELAPLEEGEYFLHDLVGLTVLDHRGSEVGPVENFMETGGPPLLVILGPDGKEFLIPFASGTIDEVDLDGGTIRIANLPGLIE